jgi:hypothetical protein
MAIARTRSSTSPYGGCNKSTLSAPNKTWKVSEYCLMESTHPPEQRDDATREVGNDLQAPAELAHNLQAGPDFTKETQGDGR